MELRQLRYFIAVAEELSFTRAARRLHLSQPPLSQQIQQLERELGARLLSRTTRRVELTAAGIAFLDGARRTVFESERAGELARRADRGEVETLRVGFTDAASMSVLPEGIVRFKREFPEVHLDLRETDGAASPVEAVGNGTLDVVIVRGPLEASGIAVKVLLDDPFDVAMHGGHPLARRARVSVPEIALYPLVLFPRRLSPAYHDRITSIFSAIGVTVDIAFEVEKYQTVLALVAAGMGISIVPRSNRRLAFGGVIFRPLRGTRLRAPVVAAYRAAHVSRALRGFLSALGNRHRSSRARFLLNSLAG